MIARLNIFLYLLLLSFGLSAQQICGTDSIHRKSMADPQYRANYNNANIAARRAWAQKRSTRTFSGSAVYTVPVVFHVMHKGEPIGTGVNLSDEQIRAALKELNERYRKIPGSIGDGNSVDMQIQFALAVRDPNGNCTTGINRVDMRGYQNYMDHGMDDPLGMDELVLKALSSWDSHYYANVWIVSYAKGTAGFAHYAPEHGSPKDGVVMTPAALNTSIFTHEFGHYLNLIHTFGDWNGSCVTETDCTLEGDLVCDTPPQEPGASCTAAPNACVPGQMLEAVNYMSYSCQSEFTEGQKQRALYAISVIRASMLGENGNMALVPQGLAAPYFTLNRDSSCLAPGSEIRLLDRTPCMPNTYVNTSPGTALVYNWTMTNRNGITLTSTDQNPVFAIPASGSYDVSLTIITAQDSVSLTRQDFVVTDGPPLTPSCPAQTTAAIDPFRVDDIGIREVVLNNLHHISGTSVEDVAAGVTDTSGYADFSCKKVAALEPFTAYTMSVRLSEFYDEHVYVYIDFDNNGITADDLVSSAQVPLGSGLYQLPSFTTPGFPLFNTRLRMRVIDVDSSDPAPAACGDIGYYGQIHDYSVVFNNVFPVANNDTADVDEDHALLLAVANNDADPDGTLLLGTIDLDPSTPFFQPTRVASEGRWTAMPGNKISFTPNANFNGPASIQYTVADNRYATSLPATVIVTVKPVNDAPSFIKGADQIVNGGAGAQTITSWATAVSAGPSNESAQTLTFIVTNDNNPLFSVEPSVSPLGNLSYTVAANAFGTATIRVLLQDNGGTANGGIDTSAVQTFTITVNPTVLPITLVGFDAKAFGNKVLINWATSAEKNNNYFTVERSQNGKDFFWVAEVKGAGNSNSQIAYSATDPQPYQGSSYYRLRQTDFDGHSTVAQPKAVTILTGAYKAMYVYPNPSFDHVDFAVNTKLKELQLTLTNMSGKILLQAKGSLPELNEALDKKYPYLQTGTYLLHVTGVAEAYSTKLIKN